MIKGIRKGSIIWLLLLSIALLGAAILASFLTPGASIGWGQVAGWLWLLLPVLVVASLVEGGRHISEPVPYSPTLAALAPFGVMMAVAGTVFSYILQLELFGGMIGGSAVIIGLILGVAAWLVAGLVYSYLGLHRVDSANQRSYGLLRSRLAELDAKLDILRPSAAQLTGRARSQRRRRPPQLRSRRRNQARRTARSAGPSCLTALVRALNSTQAPRPEAVMQGVGQGAGAVTKLITQGDGRESDALTKARWTAYREAEKQRDFLRNALNPFSKDPAAGSLQWVSGYGYIELWNRLHRAEEALIKLEPIEELTGYVAHDWLRLQGANIPNRQELLGMMQTAVERLDLPHWDYSSAHSSGTSSVHWRTPKQTGSAQTEPPTQTQVQTALPSAPTPEEKRNEELEDRDALQQVRHTVNEFRDSSWEGIVQARNYRIEATTFTGLAAYFLLIVAILPDVLTKPLQAATVFFLVGATIGLFSQLRAGVESNTRVDDYGLWHSRLVSTPIFSGLAAIGGVVLFAMVPKLLNAEAISPQTTTPTPIVIATSVPTGTLSTATTVSATETRLASATATSEASATLAGQALGAGLSLAQPGTITATSIPSPTSTRSPSPTVTATAAQATPVPPTPIPTPVPGAAAAPERLPTLEQIFSLERNLFGLLVAATFGLVPSLIFSALQKQVNKYNLDIQSTEPQANAHSSNP